MTHYVTRQYPGYPAYEGFNTVEEAHAAVSASSVEAQYIGEYLTFEAMEKEIKYTEHEAGMQDLQGSEKQVKYARQIRYRYYYYLAHRYKEQEANQRFATMSKQAANSAAYWIDTRYSLAVTSQESLYVVSGKGDIWAM